MTQQKVQPEQDNQSLSSNDEDLSVYSNVEGLELYSDSHPFRLSLRISNFDSEASYKKFVKNCEMLVRKSNEYKLWKEYIIDVLQVNTCMITHEDINEVTIEVHHHIPSLYGVVCAIVNKNIEDSEEFCTFDIARETIELHFKNRIGYVTLIRTMHEKFHNGHLDIPIEFVKGDYRRFIADYSRYMEDEDLNRINSRLTIHESNVGWSKDNYPAAAEA